MKTKIHEVHYIEKKIFGALLKLTISSNIDVYKTIYMAGLNGSIYLEISQLHFVR